MVPNIPHDIEIFVRLSCETTTEWPSPLLTSSVFLFTRLPLQLLSRKHSSPPVDPHQVFPAPFRLSSSLSHVTACFLEAPCILLAIQSCSLILICQGSYIYYVYDTELGNIFPASLPYVFLDRKYKRQT